jgi:TfuA protein
MRSLNPVVFAGISVSHAQVRALAAAECRPPVKAGDLDKLAAKGSTVLIIDGELAPGAVLPADEIVRALARGFDIRGASSVGALRASELRKQGMRGSGWVYEAFLRGRIAGTEEIAVLYDPRSFRPLTMPLVTVRFWLDGFVSRGTLAGTDADKAMDALADVKLEDRTYPSLWLRLAETPIAKQITQERETLTCPRYDVKANDAFNLLRSVAGA